MSIASSSVDDSGGRNGARETVRADVAALRPAKLVLSDEGHVGEALRLARESLDLAIEDIAPATRIRARLPRRHRDASSLGALPARPFAVGYVKAYAQRAGLSDQDAVVARFRREAAPARTHDLRPAAGRAAAGAARASARPGRSRLLIVCAALAGWNLMVRP